MHKVHYLLILVVMIVLGGLLFISANRLPSVTTAQKLQNISVQFGWLHNPQFAGFYVADEKGFYKAEGLAVTFKEYQEGVNQISDVQSGVTDFGVSTPVEILPAVQEGKEIKAIAAIYQTGPWALATLKTSNIKSPADFKGKKLGAKGDNSEAKIKYLALMNKYNVKPKDASVIAVDYSMDEADDLRNGRADVIDLYRSDQPYLMKEKGVDFTLLLPENFGVTGYGDTIISSDKLITANPQVVDKFVKATMKGWQYAINHPEEALTITMHHVNKDYSDEKRDKFILEQSLQLIKPTGDSGLGDMSFLIWSETAKNMEDAGVLGKHFDVTKAYTTKFIEN